MRVLGVSLKVLPSALLPGLILGALTYLLLHDHKRRVVMALAGGALWYEAEVNHVAGHMLTAQLAGVPMDHVRLGMLAATLYDNNDVTPRQHIGRAIGGPVGSTFGMLCWWAIWRALRGKPGQQIALIASIYNTALAVGCWTPLPWIDGGVILKNIRYLGEAWS